MTDIIQAGIEIDVTGVDKGEVALKRLAQAGDQVDKSFERGAKAAKGAGDATAQAGREADKARGSFSGFTQETKEMAAATNSLTSAAGKLGTALGSAFALSKTISTITAFEDSILRLRATSNASADAMAQLEKQARTLGATSSYSASQAADAQNFLAMAGLKVNEILSATPAVMKFASAASIDLARSADIATNVLGGMQLPVSELERTMNAMVSTAQSANTDINQLGSAFAYAAPLAVTAAIDVETLAASIGVLGDAGIQGSRAGTGMVGVIRQLSNATPDAQKALATYGLTMADVDIKSRGLVNVLDTLQKANLSTSDAMKIFGSESAAAALILSSSADKVRELADANSEAAGKLDEVSSILDSSLSKSFAAVSSAIEEFMLQTGDNGLSKTLKILSTAIAGLINNMNGMLPEFAKASGISQEFERNIRAASTVIKVAGTGIAAYGLAVTVAGAKTKAAAAWNALYALSMKEVAKEATLATKAVTTIQKAIALAGAAMIGWEIGTYLRKEFEIVEKAGIALMGGLHATAIKVGGYFERLGESIKFSLTNPLDAFRNKLADLLQTLTGLGQGALRMIGLDGFADAIGNGIEKIRSKTGKEHRAMLEQMKKDTQREADAVSDIYAQMFADVGKGAGEAAKTITGVIKPTKKLGDEVEGTGRKILTSASSAKELARALKELEREQEKSTKSAVDAAKALSKGNDELRREIDSIGKTKRELVAMEQQRNNVTAAALKEAAAVLDVSIAQDKELGTTKDLIALKEKERDAILEQIDLIDERNRLLGEKIDTEEVYESQKKIADQWQSLSDDMGRTFTDAIIQGGANAKEAIKRMFTNLVLRPIIEPIMQGVAGMFTGVLGGGQSGGLMGMLSGGSGGGGFSLGNVASMGSKIYSAFTGWGRAAVEGWNQSGVTGIFTGIRDYYAGTLSSMGGGLSALTAGMKGAYLAPGLAGPTTAGATGMMGVGNMLGNLSRMAGPLSVIAGALQGYQSAGIKGAAVGAGTAWGGMKLGAMAGSFLGPIGSAIGGALGGVLGAIGGGKIFGSGEKYKRTYGSASGYYRDGEYVSTGSITGGRQFGEDYDNLLDAANKAFNETLGAVFNAFDIDSTISTSVATRLRRTSGRLATTFSVQIGDELALAFQKQYGGKGNVAKATDQLVSDMLGQHLVSVIQKMDVPEHFKNQLTGLTDAEEVAATITDIFNRFEGVNAILEITGHAAYELTNAGMILSDRLLDIAGGLENLAGASDVYYKNFFTAEEQFEHAFSAMEQALDDAGLSAIDSREAYREMVEGLDLTTEAGQEMFAIMMDMAGTASEYFGILEGYQNTLEGMQVALDAEPALAYTAVLQALQADFDAMAAELEAVGLATDENIATLEAFRQHMAEMAALDLFEGGQSMADALRQGLLGTWDGGDIGTYIAGTISDGVYGAIAGQFANQITDILMQGVIAPMINAAMTGASISGAVSSSTISAMVAQAQAVAQVAADVMGQLRASGVLDELQNALGGSFTMPSVSYVRPTYTPPRTSSGGTTRVDDSWKRLLESIIKQTERAQQQIADMGRTTYEKGLAAIASTVADYQAQIAQSTASKRKQLTDELALMEQAERKLLEAQMDQRAADLLAGLADELERMGKTDAELAIMSIEKQTRDYINSLQDVGRATAENIAQVEAWSQAMKDAASRDAQIRAASDAYDALGRAVESQRSVIIEALELARDVADAAGSAAKDLFSNVLGASDANAAQARAFISDALSTARSTGYLPDGDQLREAIDSATRGFDDAAAVSIADANWQKLVLANQLKELADLAEPQVDYAQSQLDALDNMLQNARDQLDVLQGIDNSVLTVAEALSRFNEVVGNGQIITPESPVFTPEMPPQPAAPDNRAQEVNAELVAEVIELRNYMREIQRETKRTADAVNGRGDAPMLVETV